MTRYLLLIVACALAGAHAGAPSPCSPIDVAAHPSGAYVYVAEHTAGRIAVVDLAAGRVVRTISVPGRPGGLAVTADGAALLVDASDVDALAEASARALRDRRLRSRLRRQGLERASQFSWQRTARGTVAAYEAAVSLARG